MTKVIFTPLRETDLYDQAKVRGMLTNERLLSNEQTFLKKLEERHIKLLVFVKLDAAPANLSMHAMVVRLDDAKQFPPDGFQTAVLLGKRNEDFEELALNRAPPRIRSTLSELTQPPQQTMKKIEGGDRFLVLIACFREYTGQPRIGSLPVQYWKTEIPARLADELRSEKDQFPDKLFVVQFEGGECPRKDDDIKNWLSKNFSNYPDQHWFAWFGSIYSYGTNNVVIGLEFVHFVKENRWSKTEHMVDETGRVMEMPKRIAEFTKDKWEAYLQYVAPVRPEVWPLPGRMAGPR